MTTKLVCDEHGDDVATYVCVHVIDSLRDLKPRGFSWSVDDEDEYQAVCADCRAMPRKRWRKQSSELGRILCFSCYKKAAALNGIDVDAERSKLQ